MPQISDEELEELISNLSEDAMFSVGREKASSVENEIISSAKNIDDISSSLDSETLEMLRNEGQERLSQQAQTIQHLQQLGFQVARSSIVVLWIIVSGVAILLQQDLMPRTSNELAISVIGLFFIGVSAIAGTFWPLIQSYYSRRQSENTNNEYFDEILPENIEEETEMNRLLVRILIQQTVIARVNSIVIKRL